MPERSPEPQTPMQEFVTRIKADRWQKVGRLNYLVFAQTSPALDTIRSELTGTLHRDKAPTLRVHRVGLHNTALAGDIVVQFAVPDSDLRGLPLDGALAQRGGADWLHTRITLHRCLQTRSGWFLEI